MRGQALRIMAAAVVATALCAGAQEQGFWRANNNTAKSITGDIALSADKLSINFLLFTIANIRTLQPAEVSAVFDVDSSAPAGTAVLYKTMIAGDRKFLHKNTLCANDAAQWIVTYTSGRTMQMAIFSGDKPPVFTFDALNDASNRCGTFSYVR